MTFNNCMDWCEEHHSQDAEQFHSPSPLPNSLPYPFVGMSTNRPLTLLTTEVFSLSAVLPLQEF